GALLGRPGAATRWSRACRALGRGACRRGRRGDGTTASLWGDDRVLQPESIPRRYVRQPQLHGSPLRDRRADDRVLRRHCATFDRDTARRNSAPGHRRRRSVVAVLRRLAGVARRRRDARRPRLYDVWPVERWDAGDTAQWTG